MHVLAPGLVIEAEITHADDRWHQCWSGPHELEIGHDLHAIQLGGHAHVVVVNAGGGNQGRAEGRITVVERFDLEGGEAATSYDEIVDQSGEVGGVGFDASPDFEAGDSSGFGAWCRAPCHRQKRAIKIHLGFASAALHEGKVEPVVNGN